MLLDPEDMSLRGTILGWEARHKAGLSNECEGRYAGSLWCTPSLAHFWQHYGRRVHPGRLHGHMCHAMTIEPVTEREQRRGGRGEGADLFSEMPVGPRLAQRDSNQLATS